jgi:Phage integrase, N-terminal SAM-like domain
VGASKAEKLRRARERPKSKGGKQSLLTSWRNPSFTDYFRYWTDEHAARRCAPKTLERYKEFGRYLEKHLGDSLINELTTAQIQHAIHRLHDAGGQTTKEFPNGKPLAPKTVRHIGTLLYTELAEADRLGDIEDPTSDGE